MKFEIGSEVKEKQTNEVGIVTDRMYSEAKSCYMYIVKSKGYGRSIMRKDDELEEVVKTPKYEVVTEIADNVVIGIIYKVQDDVRKEVFRGHAHIIHEGDEGVAQACCYAYRQAFAAIDTGIYFKQRRSQ